MHIHRLCTARINEGETNASPSPPTLGCPNAMRHTLLLLTTETAGAEEGRRRPHRLADAPARTCKRAAGRSPGGGGRGGGGGRKGRGPPLAPIKLSAPSGQKITKFAEHHWLLGLWLAQAAEQRASRSVCVSARTRSPCWWQGGRGTEPSPPITRWR